MRCLRFVALLIGLLTAVAGCVSVPESGPVEKVEGQPPQCTNCINVAVAPPTTGDSPKQIVQGFLRATSNYQPSYSVARQFLTQAAAESWSPEVGANIYSGEPQANGAHVVLRGHLLGRLGRDRTFTPENAPLTVDFGIVREGGQWRISRPPAGLMVAEFAFSSFYSAYSIYFIGNGRSLVPDVIYLPNLRNQAALASVLLKTMLTGPSAWLKPAVSTAFPAGTALNVDAVTVSDSVADVPLNDVVLPLNDSQRSLLAAQVVYTLAPLGIRGVRFTVKQQPFAVPGAEPDTQEVSLDTDFGDLEPVPTTASDQLYAMRSRGMEQVNAASDVRDSKPMPGQLGSGRIGVESLGVSLSGTDLVVVTDRGTVLRRGTTAQGTVTTLPTPGFTGLLRPQFSRFGEIWALGQQGGRQRFEVFAGGERTEVDADVLRTGRVLAFKIGPDGIRMGIVREVGGRTELGLARIVRSDKIVVEGWRPLPLDRTSPALTRMVDVVWASATDLVVLAGSSKDNPLSPYRVTQDANTVTLEGEPNDWDAVGVTASLGTQTSIVLGRDQKTWRDGGSQWVPYLDRVRAIAYPG